MKLQNKVRVLAIGDIIGKGGRNAFIRYIPTLKEKYQYDLLIVNGENVTHGRGMNYKHYLALKDAGVDVITMGNHVFDEKDIYNYIDKADNLVVPGNMKYDDQRFDEHKCVLFDFNGHKIAIYNIVSPSIMGESYKVENPIAFFDEIYKEQNDYIYIFDFHAEYTLEKNLLAYYVDGKASLIYGTHTHVQTADDRILPNKTAFISDIGMCGSIDSIIGYDYISYMNKIHNNSKTFVSERVPLMINGIVVDIDLDNKQALSIKRIKEKIA
ncbi:MAG: YmdB family metallophosphoesterase [Erysipelotrichaceae bacterium]|nr:YmdB family metallophosphoesterase [Erysipelotrichaceae bacterium]